MANVPAVRASFNEVAAYGEEVPYWFYSYLWASHPDARAFFPPDMRIQRDRLVKALIRIVGDADRAERLMPYLKQLGRNHAARYSVQPHHYDWVGEALLATLAHFLGDKWTVALERDWAEVYNVIAATMIEGAREGYGQDDAEQLTAENTDRALRGRIRRRIFGYSRSQVDEFRGVVIGMLEQLVSDNADLRRTQEEADTEIRRLRDYYYAKNNDLHRESREAFAPGSVTAADVEELTRAQRAAEANGQHR